MLNSDKKILILRSLIYNVIEEDKSILYLHQIDTINFKLNIWTSVKKLQEKLIEKLKFLTEYYEEHLNFDTKVVQISNKDYMFYLDITFKETVNLDTIIFFLKVENKLNSDIDSLNKGI